MEVIGKFFNTHKTFFILLVIGLLAYYLLVYLYLRRKHRKPKKTSNNNIFSVLNKKDKNISILAPELDDVPVIDDDVSTSGETPSEDNDWKKYLDEINEQSDRIRQNELLDDLLDDKGIDTED